MSRGRMQEQYPTAGQAFAYRVEESSSSITVYLDDEAIELDITRSSLAEGWCRWQGRTLPFVTAWIGDELHVWLDGVLFIFQRLEEQQRDRRALRTMDEGSVAPTAGHVSATVDARHITSRLSGSVLLVFVQPGDSVSVGDEICIVEAMKMEHSIRSSVAGTVKAVNVTLGQQVSIGDILVELEGESDST